MSSSNLCIDLHARKDSEGNVYYVGKLKMDCLLNCKDGVAFLVFVSDKGNEQLQISSMDKNRD